MLKGILLASSDYLVYPTSFAITSKLLCCFVKALDAMSLKH